MGAPGSLGTLPGFPSGFKVKGHQLGDEAMTLKEEGHWIRAVDWKENEYMKEGTFCDEFLNLDLRLAENCKPACEGMDWVFNLAVRAPLTATGACGLQR